MKHWMIGGAAAAALLTACGGGDDATEADISVEQATTVGEVRLPGLSLRSGDPSEAGEALAAFYMDESADGRVSFADKTMDGASATFTDVAISVEEDETPLRAGSLSFAGLEMTETGPSFAQMTLNDISVSPEDEEGQLLVSMIQLTNPSPELAGWVASLFGEGEPAAFPAAQTVSFDGLSLEGLSLSGEGLEELEVFEIGKIDLRGMGPETLQALVFEGMNFSVKDDEVDVKMSLGSLRMSGADTSFIEALQDAGGDEDEMAAAIMSLASQNPLDPGYNAILLDNFTMDLGGVDFALPSMEAVVTRDSDGRAVRSVTKPFEMTLAADPEGEFGAQLAGPLGLMGYEELKFSGAQDYAMDPDTDTITSQPGSNFFALEDGFRMSGGGKVSGMTEYFEALADPSFLGAVENDPTAIVGALSSMNIHNMEMTLEDDSIVERAFTLASAMSGQDADTLRGQAQMGLGFAPLAAGEIGIDPAILTELAGALSSFLAEPGTLTIKLDPDAPLSVDSFSDPSQITKTSLGFSATHAE